jgi:hypothetical protein
MEGQIMEEMTMTVTEELNNDAVTDRNFDLTSYARAKERMIATTDRAYAGRQSYFDRIHHGR